LVLQAGRSQALSAGGNRGKDLFYTSRLRCAISLLLFSPATFCNRYNIWMDSKARKIMSDYLRFARREHDGPSWGLALTMLLVGVGAGALTGLLLAPYSGRQTRKMLRKRYEDAVDDIAETTEELRERSAEWMDRARDFAGTVGESADDVKQRVKSAAREVRKRVES